MKGILIVAYIALGIVQLFAFMEGLDSWLRLSYLWGLIAFVAAIMFGGIGGVAIAVVGYFGATEGWGWEPWQALLLCFPFAVLGFLVMAAAGVRGLLLSVASPAAVDSTHGVDSIRPSEIGGGRGGGHENPFDDPAMNIAYGKAQKISEEAGREFRRVAERLGDTVDPDDLLSGVRSKFQRDPPEKEKTEQPSKYTKESKFVGFMKHVAVGIYIIFVFPFVVFILIVFVAIFFWMFQ